MGVKQIVRKWRVHRLFFTKEGPSHLRWIIKKYRADLADWMGWNFSYVYPLIGRFVYHPSDMLSRRLLLYGNFEEKELYYAIQRAKRGGLILDIGANIGLFSVACGRAAGSQGRVMAFEAGPKTFKKLKTTLHRLNVTNVVPFQIAIGSKNGITRFLESPNGKDVHQRIAGRPTAEDFETVTVPMRRLNDLCGKEVENVTLLKIDIEGYEIEALKGAEKILKNGKVNLIVEFYPKGLADAGGTVAQLWEVLERTHCCTSIVCQDGVVRSPNFGELISIEPHETFNTFWAPKLAD